MTGKWTIGRANYNKTWIASNDDSWAEFDTHTAALKYVHEEIKESYIIRDPEDLNQHDLDTIVIDSHEDIGTVEDLAEHINNNPQSAETLFPAVILTPGAQARAARKVLGYA